MASNFPEQNMGSPEADSWLSRWLPTPAAGQEPAFRAPSVVDVAFADQSPEVAAYRSTRRMRLVDGSVVSAEELAQSKSGARLLEVSQRIRPYDFWSSIADGGLLSWDFVPYVGMLAQVGGALSEARAASNAFHKMQAGEPLTRDEAIAATLSGAESEMRANGTWGATVGRIIRAAPAFFMEFGLTSAGGQALRSAVVHKAASEASEASVKFLTYAGVTRATKNGAAEIADGFVRSAIKADLEAGTYATAAQAAKAYLDSNVFIARTAAATSQGVQRIIASSAPYVTGVRQWAPGLADKVSEALSERAVRASLAYLSRDSRWARYFMASRQAIGRSLVEGVVDLGEWGAGTVSTGFSQASRAFAQAGLDLTFGAGARGLALFAPREAARATFGLAMEAATGYAPVRESTLGMERAAWQNGDEALMSRAETYGMFLDLLEYVSESSGRGFNNLFRGIGLAAAPKLMRPAAKIAGMVETKGATQIARDAAGSITGVVYDVGLVDAARGTEVGGAIARYIDKVAGGRSLKENVLADRLAAVKHKLSKAGVSLADDVTLSAAIEAGMKDGRVSGRLGAAVAEAIGSDMRTFVKTAVKEANQEIKNSLKLHGMFAYYVADFMARHNYDARRVYEKFVQMGYDGVFSEMMEERYVDVASTLFGLDAEHIGYGERLGKALRRAFMPDGGWKQLVAEAVGFSVPMGVRAGVMRTIAAMGSANDYANQASWAASLQDTLHYGSIQHFKPGDYIARVAGQASRLRDAAAAQRKKASAPEGRPRDDIRDEVLIQEAEREGYSVDAENRTLRAPDAPADAPGISFDDFLAREGVADRVEARVDEEVARESGMRRQELEASAEGYERAAVRAERLRDEFLKTVDPKAEEFAAPVYSDAALTLPDAEYNQTVLPVTAAQATSALVGYRNTLAFAGKAGQLQYKALHRTKDEAKHWFKRASHWVVEHALRLGGALATGDLAFISANPAMFAAADRGVNPHLLDSLQKAYGKVYEATLRESARVVEGSGGNLVADTDAAHELALERFQPQAEKMVAHHLAAMQTYMFSHDELRDIALVTEAEKDGYMVDALQRKLVAEDGAAISYDDYLARDGVAERVDAQVEKEAGIVFGLLTNTSGMRTREEVRDEVIAREAARDGMVVDAENRTVRPADTGTAVSYDDYLARDGVAERVDAQVEEEMRRSSATMSLEMGTNDRNILIRRIVNIPKGLPTAEQAVLANVLKYHPAFADAGIEGFRDVMTRARIDPDRSLRDQLFGESTRRGHLRTVSEALTQGKPIRTVADFNAALARIDQADPGLVELIGRDLGYSHDFTDKGKKTRDEAVARYAIAVTLFDDPDVAVFERSANINEDDQRLGTSFAEIATARRTPEGWEATFRNAQDGTAVTVTRATLDELEEVAASDDYGYAKRDREIVHTPVRTLYADTAQDFISALDLGRTYRENQDRVAAEGHSADTEWFKDPLVRKGSDGAYLYTPEEADLRRAAEEREAFEFEYVYRKQKDAAVYLLPGENADDAAALARATARMDQLQESYERREARQTDGRALGYNAVAEDLVNANGVRGGAHSRYGNEFGVADAGYRNKFVLDPRMIRFRTGDIFIPIDHASAQSYGASMLSALLVDRIAVRRDFVHKVFDAQIRGFLVDMEKAVDAKIRDAADQETKNRWEAFADAFVRGAKDGRTATPATLGLLVQAFGLYRTEVPEKELLSALGDFAGELKELAPQVRDMPTYAGFLSMADVVLGGGGFEPSVTGDRGLALYYAVFAPHGAPGFRERTAEAHGVDYEAFARRAQQAARAAFRGSEAARPAARTRAQGRGQPSGVSPESGGREALAPSVERAVAEADSSPHPELDIARAAIAEETGDDAVSLEEIERFSSMLGGNSVEQVETDGREEPADEADEADEADDAIEEVDDDGPRRGYFSVERVDAPPTAYETSEDGSRQVDVDYRDVKELSADEAKAFAEVCTMLTELTNGTYDVKTFQEMLHRIVPDLRDKDRQQLVEAYHAMGDKGYFGGDEWAWSLDSDEEGLAPDGFENNNARNVEVLKSPIIRRLLAIMAKVSPATGRDFQPFVEDLRSFASIAPTMLAGQISEHADLAEAVQFLDRMLNPRAQPYGTACAREAAFNDLIDSFAPGVKSADGRVQVNPKRAAIRAHIAAFLRSDGDAPAPSIRAAVLLAYFSLVRNDSARRQLAQLIGQSAPASPVRLVSRDGSFVVRPENPRPGRLAMEAITSQFARWAGRPASDIRMAADRLESAFEAVVDRISYTGGAARKAPPLFRADRTGLFDTYATVLAGVFGSDAPIAVAFASLRHAIAFRNAKASVKQTFMSKFVGEEGKLPFAVQDLVGTMRSVADVADASGGTTSAALLEDASIGLFQSGAPENRHVNFANSSLMGRGAWSLLLRGYAEAKPVSVMRARIDPARTNKPASSLAITMAGVEPVIQQFLDRPDERGFRAVVDRWFPSYKGKSLDRLRQRLSWPDARGTTIVAKQTLKTAYATEVLEGCRQAYELEKSGPADQRTGNVYVPMYSGDHSSSVLIQVPLAGKFISAEMDYDQVADMVCDWFGLDLFGDDAKRSAVTCLEAPGVSLVGVQRDGAGDVVVDDQGRAQTGTCTYGIVWDSRPGANNEAMLGSLYMHGYGADRIRQMSRDPGASTLKVHIAAVGPDAAFGTIPTLTKALAIGYAPGDREQFGGFVQGSPMRALMDHAESGTGKDGLSTYLLADYDSVKLDVLNSKMVGVSDGSGKLRPLMKYVFEDRFAALLSAGEQLDGLSGAELDEKIGDIPFVDMSRGREPTPKKLSELVPDAAVRAVKGMDGVYTLERSANQLMAFQVANVSHKAKAEDGATSRNYMLDGLAMAETVVGLQTPASERVFSGLADVAADVRRLVSSWGLLGAAIGQDDKSIANMLAQDEEWQDAMHRGEPEGGPVHDQYVRKAYSAWVKTQLRTLPIRYMYAPLVSNCSWVDQASGAGVSHQASQMFIDTLQGARTIGRGSRKFWKASKRVALCNVNMGDASFRYGMYIDSEKLMSHAALADFRSPAEGDRGVVETLENAITAIAEGSADETALRLALGDCLLDHHGKTLSSRSYQVKMRNRDTGETFMQTRRLALTVSYLDLFTSVGNSEGRMEFDRSAVYTGMHDSEGNARLYLGGTMFGLPRTPSYNGSMWLQVVRAGLPVTEREIAGQDADGRQEQQWLPGTEAMVAPDPFTLKILGCDHDGDKSHLYMLNPRGSGHLANPRSGASFKFTTEDLAALFAGLDEIAASYAETGNARQAREALGAVRDRLIADGLLRYGKGREARLEFPPEVLARLSNTWVQSLFDMNRALPVPSSADGAPFYAGTVVEDDNRGLVSRGTKATPSSPLAEPGEVQAIPEKTSNPEAAWNVSVLSAPGVLAPKVLDVANGQVIKKVGVAARVQTGAAFVSDARARFVKSAGEDHLLYALGYPGGPAGRLDAADFVDYEYHKDGMSNMSFDDMKEQVCSRLGLMPGMVETFIYEFGVVRGPSLTDVQANEAVAAFARGVNDERHLYHYLSRAADPTDAEFAGMVAQHLGEAAGLAEKAAAALGDTRLGELVSDALGDRQLGGGVLEFLRTRTEQELPGAFRQVVAWWQGISSLRDASAMASTMNYTKVDPGNPYAGDLAGRMWRTFQRLVVAQGNTPARLVEAQRMFAGNQMLLEGPGSSIASRGVASVEDFRHNAGQVLDQLGEHPELAPPTHELSLVVAAYNSPRLRSADRLQAAGNAYMVGMAAAQFIRSRGVDGSPLNGDMFRKCAAIAEAAARARQPEAEDEDAVYANATLSFRYAVESMADIFSRMLSPSRVGRDIPVFNYLAEYPDATPYAYSPGVFGEAARGLSRVTVGLGDLTAEQILKVQGYWRRIVDGRELDTDRLGKDAGILPVGKGRAWNVGGRTATLEFSVDNLRVLESYLQNQRGAFSRASGGENLEESVSEGRVRDTLADVQMLIRMLQILEKNKELFPHGVRLQPSALFGQLLPVYAALTDFAEEAPGPGSRSLVSLIPGAYAGQAGEVKRILGDPDAARALAIAEAINWAPVNAYKEGIDYDTVVPDAAAAHSRTQQAAALAGSLRKGTAVQRQTNPETGRRFNAVAYQAADRWVKPMFIKGHKTLGVFDGTRSVAFSALLNCLKYGSSARLDLSPARKQVREAPGAQAGVERKPVQTPAPASGRDLAVVARSLAPMFQAWNGVKLEYDPGKRRFSLFADLQAKSDDADARLFKTRIDVYLTRNGELADADVDLRMANARYMDSVFARSGVSREAFDAMDLDARRAFVREWRPVGRTDFLFDDTPGSFQITARDLETLTAKVTLDAGSRPVTGGTIFHEAFHAVMGFVRAAGVLSAEDVGVLQAKYGRTTVNGVEWFNEESAAADYQAMLAAELAPSPETKTVQGVWARLKSFFSMLLDKLRDAFSGGHSSEDYGNDMADSPLAKIMLTGIAESSRPAVSDVSVTDGAGAAQQAAENMVAMEYAGLTQPTAIRVRQIVRRYEADRSLFGGGGLAYAISVEMDDAPDSKWVREVMLKYGPRDAESGRPVDVKDKSAVETVPNPEVESPLSDLLSPPGGADIDIDLDGVEAVQGDPDGTGFFDVQRVLPKVRQVVAGMDANRMAVPYSEHEVLASAIGAAIRDGFTSEAVETIHRYATEHAEIYEQDQLRRMREAVARVSDLYGVHTPESRERLLFKGLCQLGINLANDSQYAKSSSVRVAGGGGVPTASKVSSSLLAAAVATASGVTPGDIVESALYDLRVLADRRKGSKLASDVLRDRVIPLFEELLRESDDPTGLLERFAGDDGTPNTTISRLLAGLVPVRDENGYRSGFRLADGSSRNPDSRDNMSAYADHVDDPDFQYAMGRAADALFMLAASRNLYRDLGFVPGRPSDVEVFASRDPGAKGPLEMATELGSLPDAYADPAHESVPAMDQTWFASASPKLWLDSMLAESFGKVGLRESQQGLHAEVAGYQNRVVQLRNMHAFEYGLADSAGKGLLEVDPDYASGFAWEGGRIVHDGRRRAGVRLYKNESKTRTRVSLTLNEQRQIDMALKARRVWFTGGKKLLTGVDGLSFSVYDSSDPEYYSREKVAERVARGFGRGESVIDQALERIDRQLRDDPVNGDFDWIVDSGAGRYGLRESLVSGICAALDAAKGLVAAGRLARGDVNDYVIRRLDARGLVCGYQARRRNTVGEKFVTAAVSLDVDRIEEMFQKSSAMGKLVQAGRKPEWLTREEYVRPYRELWREMRAFVASRPFLSEGDGRFFHNMHTPLPFVRGTGAFMHEAARRVKQSDTDTAGQVRSSYAVAFRRIMSDPASASTRAVAADADTLLMMRTVFHLPEKDDASVRRAIAAGDYAEVPGLELAADGTVADAADAIYRRLVGMVWKRSAELADFGGAAAAEELLDQYRDSRNDPSLSSAGTAGLRDEDVYRMTGALPANHQLGHAVQTAMDGILNAFAYRAAVINMATAPAEDGTPLCYVKPSLDAADSSGVPDEVWGAIARWHAEIHGLAYDPRLSGVENARAIYDSIVGSKSFDRTRYGSINGEDMDTRAVEECWARRGTPEGESSLAVLAGGYALGYAKHLFQSTKGLGGKWCRAVIHRAWAYSKAMSVSFSMFFPLATRIESPIGAVGAFATLMGNISPEFVRRHSESLSKVFAALRGTGLITRDFIGERDFVQLLQSNDPFLSEMYTYAAALGLPLSNANANYIEHSRGILEQDLKDFTSFVRAKWGAKAARRVDSVAKALFVDKSEKAFAYHLNATKLAVAAQMCMKMQADAAARGVMFDPVRDLRRYSGYINAEVGGIDPLSYAWAHPKMRNFLSTLFFSWGWTRGAWEAGGGKLLEKMLFGGHDTTPEETKYLLGRAARMWGWVAFGFPQLLQIVANALALAIDPDEKAGENMRWFIWEHESKAAWQYCDLTPFMEAVARRFPTFARWRKEHPVITSTPAIAFMLTRNPWIAGAAATASLPVQTDPDRPHRRTYFRLAKQAWEFYNWFDDPVRSFFSKTSMPIQRLTEGLFGRSLASLDYKQPWADMGFVERWAPVPNSALFNLGKALLPFSLSGVGDMGTSGLLPLVGPVARGASKYAITKELEKAIGAWASSDRRGYAFGGPLRTSRSQKTGPLLAARSPGVRRLVSDAMANGFDEKDAYGIVDSAVRTVSTKERKRLVDLVPDTPDGKFDASAWGRSVRKLQRIGVLGKDLRSNLVKRLREQKRWHELTAEQRLEMSRLIRETRRHPYGTDGSGYGY